MRPIRHFLTPIGWLWGTYLAAILVLALALTACSSMNLEARAVALYGTFSAAQDTALELINSPELDDAKKLRVQQADARAKPVADALLKALQAYRQFHGHDQADNLMNQVNESREAITDLSEEAH